MIERIGEGQWSGGYAQRGQDGGDRREQRRPRLIELAATAVSIDWEAADMAALRDAAGAADTIEEGPGLFAAHALAQRLASVPRLAIAAQARLGSAAVTRLVTVNAMNRA